MFKRLKRKITLYATLSMFILMTILMVIVNVVNYTAVVKEADRTINVISQPNIPFFSEQFNPQAINPKFDEFIPRDMSVEVPFESRFFTVIIDAFGRITETDTSRILSVDNGKLITYSKKAYVSNREKGFINGFRYKKTSENNITRITFLDCGRKLESFETFALASVGVGLLGTSIVFVVFLFASKKIVYPIADSYDKQKRFISDASHELKTPLTIINANVDLLQGSKKNKEELNEIKIQTKQLAALTNDLIYLSKMDESKDSINKTDFNLSETIKEIVQQFNALIVSKKKKIELNIEDDIKLTGNLESIKRLLSILIDNAIKYSSKKSHIDISLKKQKKKIIFNISNNIDTEITKEDLDHLFDRFYRTDKSRNSETGGHGIGLSIAKEIVLNHSGNIKAYIDSNNRFVIEIIFD